MTEAPIKLVSRGMHISDLSNDLTETIKTAIYDFAETHSMPLCLVVGALELAKIEIMREQSE